MNDNKTNIKQSRSKSEFIEFTKSINARKLDYEELKRTDREYKRPYSHKPFSGFAVGETLLINEYGNTVPTYSVNYFDKGQLKQFKTFYEPDRFQSEGQYEQKGPLKLNIRHGTWTTYFKNGKKKLSGIYDFGTKVGVWKRFLVGGNIIKTAQYKDGNLQKYSKFYKTGELPMKEKVLSIEYDKRSPSRTITEIKTSYSHFFKNGNVKAKGEHTYTRNFDPLHFPLIEFDEEGVISSKTFLIPVITDLK